MDEAFSGAEHLSSSATPSGGAEGPGYPTPEQLAALNHLAGVEQTAAQNDQAKAAGLLEELETGETTEARQARLTDFIARHCADLNIPTDRLEAVVLECQAYEDEYRALFDPGLQIEAEDAPSVRDKILALVPPIEQQRAQLGDNEKGIASNAEQIKDKAANTDSQDVDERADTEQQHLNTINTLADLQSEFDTLRQDEGGTLGALRHLLAPPPEGVESPRVREVVQKVYNIAQALQDAVPNKPEVVSALLEASQINFAASQPDLIFAGFMTAAETNPNLSQTDVAALRQVLADPKLVPYIRNGADVRKAGRTTQLIRDPETGEIIGEEYLYTSKENFAPIRPGVGTYMHGERQMLFLTESGKARDITGLPDHYISLIAEVWAYYEATNDLGATGLLEDLGATHYDFMSDTAFDWLTLRRSRDIISKLAPGRAAGYDGRIGDPKEYARLLRAQMRVLAGNEQALGYQSHQADTKTQLATLGLAQDGVPDLEVLQVFGEYTQTHSQGFTRQEVQKHLYDRFPSRVDPPQAV